jgi:cytochrome c oxidase subunit 1
VPLLFRKDYIFRPLARIQPYMFAGGIVLVSLGMSFAGSLGVARRSWDIEATGSVHGPSAHLFLAVMGVGAIMAFLALMLFILLTVGTLLFGKSNVGRAMADWGVPKTLSNAGGHGHEGEAAIVGAGEAAHDTRGTLVLALVFLACFAVYYFANWKALADVWPVH